MDAKEFKLISMTDFVLQQANYTDVSNISEKYAAIWNYARFLKQPLKLEMFVPCDEDGNVLSEPKPNDLNGSFFKMQESFNYEKQFDEAKEKVLFEGFEFVEANDKNRFVLRKKEGEQVWAEMTKYSDAFYFKFPKLYTQNVEDLICDVEIELTPTAIKQIGL